MAEIPELPFPRDGASVTKRSRLPHAVVLLGLTSFFTDVGSEMIFPLLPAFVASLGAGTAFLGLVEGAAETVASLLKLASGVWIDRAPVKKPLVVAGYGMAAFVRPLVSLATAPWHVLTVRVTDRIGKGIRSTPRDVLLANSVPASESGRAFGFHRALDHAGAVVGPLVATLLLALHFDLRFVFAATLLPGLVAVACAASVREPESVVEAPATAMTSPSGAALPVPLRNYLFIVTLFALGNSSDAFLLLRARELGIPLVWLPVLWSVFHAVKAVSSYWSGDLSDRVPRHTLVIAGWLVYAATYLGFALATQAIHAWALFIFYGLYYGLTEPTEKALVKDLAPANACGRAFGAYNFIGGATAIPASVMTGFAWESVGPLTALSIGATLALLASLSLAIWSRTSMPRAH